MNATHNLILKYGPKMLMKFYFGIKNQRIFLDKTKTFVYLLGSKTYLTLKKYIIFH